MTNHTITENFIRYYPQLLNFSKDFNSSEISKGFICKIRLKEITLNREEKVILEIKGLLRIYVRLLKKDEDIRNLNGYDLAEQFFVYADKSGNSPIICAELYLEDEYTQKSRSIRVGVPLNLYDAVNEDIYLLYDGIRFSWIYDGKIINSNFPFGNTTAGELWYEADCFKDIGFCCELAKLKTQKETEKTNRSIAYYSFPGYNDWAGDVVNFWYDGTYHLLVLYDRHHHGNRFGGGAHTTMHLTTRDFINWENHGEVYSFKYPWETFGTGTMFYHNGKYYYSFGLHTSRMIPDDKTAGHIICENYRKNGETVSVSYDEIFSKGLYPNGANYLVSDDGINFVPSNIQVHWSENPSIYANDDGTLTMYAGYGADGAWKAPCIEGPWKPVNSNFPTAEMRKLSGCTTECPSLFEWNGYKYLLIGFTGFFQTEKNGDTFFDMASKGFDIYDGLCVPMVAECNGRYILSGWLGGFGWAYVIAHRELVQKENGILGIKWMPEYTPDTKESALSYEAAVVSGNTELSLESKNSYYLEFTVIPDVDSKVGIGFSGDGKSFVMSLNTKTAKVQTNYSEDVFSFPKELPSLSEYIEQYGAIENYHKLSGDNLHKDGVNFSIVNVDELKREYKFKMILHYEPKSDSLIIDAEIGSGRTFISNRKNFTAQRLTLFGKDVTVKDLKLYNI